MSPELADLASLAVAAVGLGLPAVWHLSSKIAKVSSDMDAVREVLAEVRRELRESRGARAQLWQEINSLRERVAKIETRSEL